MSFLAWILPQMRVQNKATHSNENGLWFQRLRHLLITYAQGYVFSYIPLHLFYQSILLIRIMIRP